jgi:hypothetical protein
VDLQGLGGGGEGDRRQNSQENAHAPTIPGGLARTQAE